MVVNLCIKISGDLKFTTYIIITLLFRTEGGTDNFDLIAEK